MPRDYARATSRKKKTTRRSSKKRFVWLRPTLYIVLGMGVSYAFQHPQWAGAQWQSMMVWVQSFGASGIQDDHVALAKDLRHQHIDVQHASAPPASNMGVDDDAEKKPDLQFYDILRQAKGLMHRSRGSINRQRYTIQVGAFLNPASCRHMVQKLKQHDFPGRVEQFERQGVAYCRVLVGGFENLSQAYEVKNRLYAEGVVGVLRQQASLARDA